MPFDLIHFRDSGKILKQMKMLKEVTTTLKYLDDVLYEAPNPAKLLKEALSETGWRENGTLAVLEGRGYQFKGMKHCVALEGNFSAYEFILEGLLRLQVAFDKGTIQAGVLMLTAARSERTRFGSTRELCEWEIEQLRPTISMPVSVALFDLGNIIRREKPEKREDLSELRDRHQMNGEPGETGEGSDLDPVEGEEIDPDQAVAL